MPWPFTAPPCALRPQSGESARHSRLQNRSPGELGSIPLLAYICMYVCVCVCVFLYVCMYVIHTSCTPPKPSSASMTPKLGVRHVSPRVTARGPCPGILYYIILYYICIIYIYIYILTPTWVQDPSLVPSRGAGPPVSSTRARPRRASARINLQINLLEFRTFHHARCRPHGLDGCGPRRASARAKIQNLPENTGSRRGPLLHSVDGIGAGDGVEPGSPGPRLRRHGRRAASPPLQAAPAMHPCRRTRVPWTPDRGFDGTGGAVCADGRGRAGDLVCAVARRRPTGPP